MKLYESASPPSVRVRWTFRQLKLPYESVLIDSPLEGGKGGCRIDSGATEPLSPDMLRINPAGKLPVLDDHGFIMTESAAIMLYLAEQHPEQGLIPPSRLGRATVNKWMFFCISELEQPLLRLSRSAASGEPDKGVSQEGSTKAQLEAGLGVLEAHMERRNFCVGDGLTLADLMLGSTLEWARSYGLLESPTLSAYADRLYALPGAPPRLASAR